MTIDSYAFGKIVVDGETYTSDVVIHSGGVEDSWWRKQGHRLDVADLGRVLEAAPDTLVVGTGFYGNMVVPEETLAYLGAKGVEVRVAETGEAVALFNRLDAEPDRRVVAALHLTC